MDFVSFFKFLNSASPKLATEFYQFTSGFWASCVQTTFFLNNYFCQKPIRTHMFYSIILDILLLPYLQNVLVSFFFMWWSCKHFVQKQTVEFFKEREGLGAWRQINQVYKKAIRRKIKPNWTIFMRCTETLDYSFFFLGDTDVFQDKKKILQIKQYKTQMYQIHNRY